MQIALFSLFSCKELRKKASEQHSSAPLSYLSSEHYCKKSISLSLWVLECTNDVWCSMQYISISIVGLVYLLEYQFHFNLKLLCSFPSGAAQGNSLKYFLPSFILSFWSSPVSVQTHQPFPSSLTYSVTRLSSTLHSGWLQSCLQAPSLVKYLIAIVIGLELVTCPFLYIYYIHLSLLVCPLVKEIQHKGHTSSQTSCLPTEKL